MGLVFCVGRWLCGTLRPPENAESRWAVAWHIASGLLVGTCCSLGPMLQWCTASDQSLLWEEITSVKNQLTNDANGPERSSLLGVTRIDVDLQWRIQEILWMVVSTDIWRYLIWDFCLIATASTSLGLLWPSIFYGPVLPLSQESCNLNMYKLRLDSDLLRRLWLSPEIQSYLPWTPFWIIDYFLSFKDWTKYSMS